MVRSPPQAPYRTDRREISGGRYFVLVKELSEVSRGPVLTAGPVRSIRLLHPVRRPMTGGAGGNRVMLPFWQSPCVKLF